MTHYRAIPIALVAVLLTAVPAWAHVNILLDGTPQVNLSAGKGQSIPFAIQVPEGVRRLTVQSFGGSGDADLFFRRGAVPTTKTYDDRSKGNRNDETIRVERPQAGWYYAVLVARREFRGASIVARFELDRRDAGRHDACPAHGGEQLVRELSGRRGEETLVEIDVPAGLETLRIATTGGRGDNDLYLSRDRRPEPKDYEFRSVGKDTREQIEVRSPAGGTWLLLVYGYARFDDVSLRVAFTGGCICGQDRRQDRRRGPPLPRGTITSPARGTAWRVGRTEWITWQTGPRVRSVRVELSLDDGRTWNRSGITTAVPADRGRLGVALPRDRSFITSVARVRLIDVERRIVLTTSEPFSIAPNPIVLPPTRRPGRGGDRRRGDTYENDNRRDRATRIDLLKGQLHTIHPDEDEDWLEFTPRLARRFALHVTGATTPLKVEVWTVGRDGKEKRIEKAKLGRTGGTVRVQAAAGVRSYKFKIEAQDDDDTGSYHVAVLPRW